MNHFREWTGIEKFCSKPSQLSFIVYLLCWCCIWEHIVARIEAHFSFRIFRKRLFNLINDLPTIFEAFCSHQLTKKNTRVDRGSKPMRSSKVLRHLYSCFLFLFYYDSLPNNSILIQRLKTVNNGSDEDANEISATSCGSCGTKHRSNFWIQCDVCERSFHGKCVKMTRAKAEKTKRYRCPSCSSK